jgi:pimeloyl-ACP methyl ester carboxylesterase
MADKTAVRPFHVSVPEAELSDLRSRINAAKWPERETVTDDSQGVPLALMQELARYWAADYDWRKCEAKLNALPQFMTEIDGLDIHFIHVRSDHAALLADRHGGFVGPPLLGKQVQPLQRRRCLRPCCRQRLSRRELPGPAELVERAYHNLIYLNEVDKGGHFAAWEQPQLFSEEVRAGFRTLR